jgi:hypothetical protein
MRHGYGADYTLEQAREAQANLVGFFDILLKIDRRENPKKYGKNKNML